MSIVKKLSLLLAAVMTVGSVTACSSVGGGALGGTSITASDETVKYAEFLKDRLGSDMPSSLVLEIADSSEEYGVDLSGLVDDEGYVIRAENGSVVILGRSDAAIDRAVRQYANYGNADSYAYTYGENYRVGGITVAGFDISEYSIMLPQESDECHAYAADNLREYIGKACGFYPEIVEYTDNYGKAIRLERVYPEDEAYAVLGDEGYTVSVTDDGNLTISGGYLRGCMYGVFGFLEKCIGYRFLYDFTSYSKKSTGDIDYLYEAEHIELPAGLSQTSVPTFALRQNIYRSRVSGSVDIKYKRGINLGGVTYNTKSLYTIANHGIQLNPELYSQYPDYDISANRQPCYTDEDIIELSRDYFVAKTNEKIAAGSIPGYDFTAVDVAQPDFGDFCQCPDCMELVYLDGGNIGPVLNFTNIMADAIAEECSDKLYVSMLAYWGTSSVPNVTRPRDNVSVSYCFYNDFDKYVCYNHCISGDDCLGTEMKCGKLTNKPYGDELRGWCEMASNVLVWYYPGYWDYDGMVSPIVPHVLEDMRFLAECGVDGLYICCSALSTPMEKLLPYALSNSAWNAYMTDEEYDELIREYYMILCGDGYEYIYEYHRRIEGYAKDECWSLMAWSYPSERMDMEKVAAGFEYDMALFERALELAGSEMQERFIGELQLQMCFTGLVSVHTGWYLDGDAESAARYQEIYDIFTERAVSADFILGASYNGKGDIHISEHADELDVSKNLAELYNSEDEWWLIRK